MDYFVESSFTNKEEIKEPNESEANTANKQIEFTNDICLTGNQVLANLFGEFSIKQKPNPVINVPTRNKVKWTLISNLVNNPTIKHIYPI